MKLADGVRFAQRVIDLLAEAGCKVDVFAAGSIRREKAFVNDIDLIAPQSPYLITATEKLLESGNIQQALYGPKMQTRWGEKLRGFRLAGNDTKIELFMHDQHNRGWVTFLRTGPGDAGKYIQSWMKYRKAPFYFEDGYGHTSDGRKLSLSHETDIFNLLGIPYIVPRNRSEANFRTLLEARGHRWGDPSGFVLSEPTQPSLF